MTEDVLTADMIREAFKTGRGIPDKHYYPVNSAVWNSVIYLGWTEKQLTDMGFLKTDYIEVLE